jgi:hypothetical protein
MLQMKDAQMDATGSGHIDFDSVIVKSKMPGEDQRISIGFGPEDSGILPFDCEDFGNGNASISSQMLAFGEQDFLRSTEHAITYFPPSVQQISHTIVSMAQALHQNENANMRQAHTGKPLTLENLNMDVLQNAIAQARANPAVRLVSTCSLLAKPHKLQTTTPPRTLATKLLPAWTLPRRPFLIGGELLATTVSTAILSVSA